MSQSRLMADAVRKHVLANYWVDVPVDAIVELILWLISCFTTVEALKEEAENPRGIKATLLKLKTWAVLRKYGVQNRAKCRDCLVAAIYEVGQDSDHAQLDMLLSENN